MIVVKDKARYVSVRLGYRELKRLRGMLDYVNFRAASERWSHPDTILESEEKDRDLIQRFDIALQERDDGRITDDEDPNNYAYY